MMLIESGAVFLHVQKTGGTWLRDALTASGVAFREEGHWHDDHEMNAARWGTDRPYFTAVRNPLAWYASFYADRLRTGWGGDLALGHDCADATFGGFVARCWKNRRGFLSELYGRHARPGVAVLKTERLADDAVSLLRMLGERFDEAALRATRPANVSADRPRHTRQTTVMIVASEAEAFLKYGYGVADAIL